MRAPLFSYFVYKTSRSYETHCITINHNHRIFNICGLRKFRSTWLSSCRNREHGQRKAARPRRSRYTDIHEYQNAHTAKRRKYLHGRYARGQGSSRRKRRHQSRRQNRFRKDLALTSKSVLELLNNKNLSSLASSLSSNSYIC